MDNVRLTPELIAQATEDFNRSRTILTAAKREADAEAAKALVGRFFRARIVGGPNDEWWYGYIAVTESNGPDVNGWRYDTSPGGQMVVAPISDYPAAWFTDPEVNVSEVERTEFVARFNELLTSAARFATRIPA